MADDKTKFELILEKLDNIELGIFKLMEDKLTIFRGELSDLVDNQFQKMKEHLDKKLTGIKSEIDEKLEDHEQRLTTVETTLNDGSINKKKVIVPLIIATGALLLGNLIGMGILLYIFR